MRWPGCGEKKADEAYNNLRNHYLRLFKIPAGKSSFRPQMRSEVTRAATAERRRRHFGAGCCQGKDTHDTSRRRRGWVAYLMF